MTPKEELLLFMDSHRDDQRVLDVLLDMASRMVAGESAASIALSYGVDPEKVKELEE